MSYRTGPRQFASHDPENFGGVEFPSAQDPRFGRGQSQTSSDSHPIHTPKLLLVLKPSKSAPLHLHLVLRSKMSRKKWRGYAQSVVTFAKHYPVSISSSQASLSMKRLLIYSLLTHFIVLMLDMSMASIFLQRYSC